MVVIEIVCWFVRYGLITFADFEWPSGEPFNMSWILLSFGFGEIYGRKTSSSTVEPSSKVLNYTPYIYLTTECAYLRPCFDIFSRLTNLGSGGGLKMDSLSTNDLS